MGIPTLVRWHLYIKVARNNMFSLELQLTESCVINSSRQNGWCLCNLDHHWFEQWVLTCLEPSHYLNQAIFLWSISWLLMPWLLTSPGHQQPWYWPLNGPLEMDFIEMWIKVQQFWYIKLNLKMSLPKWQQFCLSLNVLNEYSWDSPIWLSCITDCHPQ